MVQSDVLTKAQEIKDIRSTREELDQAIHELVRPKKMWARLPTIERAGLLDEIRRDLEKIELRWVAAGMEARGVKPESLGEGEEWFSLSVIYRLINFLKSSLLDIAQGKKPAIPGGLGRRKDGTLIAKVLPISILEKLAMPGIRGEVWFSPKGENTAGNPNQAQFYAEDRSPESVCAVLGAGNVAALVPGDFLHKLFVEGQVVILKTNPVNAYLGDLLKIGFRSLIEPGYLRIVHGGEREGKYLAEHPEVDEVHITGSDRSYETLVFGKGEAGRKRKLEKSPRITKRFSAELGNISPVIVVPGPWRKSDLNYQARKLGSWLVPNAGHNCNTPRVLITMESWKHREELKKKIGDFLSMVETRKAYYPRSSSLFNQFMEVHPEGKQFGDPLSGHLPWTFITDLDPEERGEICFNTEAFISLFSETPLEADNVVDYIQRAVAFANQKLWGTLSASIVVHPKSLKDVSVAKAVDQAITDLEYGSVVINHWGALAYYASNTPWGGTPGHDMYDIQSGTGFVNNPLMFDQPHKSVISAPFRQIPDPYMADSKRNYRYFRADTRFQNKQTVGNLIKLLWAAFRS